MELVYIYSHINSFITEVMLCASAIPLGEIYWARSLILNDSLESMQVSLPAFRHLQYHFSRTASDGREAWGRG